MAIKVHNGYLCGYCGKLFVDPTKADAHRDEHELIYVPLTYDDLNRLLHYIQFGEEYVLSEQLVNTLQRYLRGN
jgi:hypothetical protein